MKEFLSRHRVVFRTWPIAEGDNLARLAARNPTLRTAPVTYVGDVEVVGWDHVALASALAHAGLGTTEVRDPSPYEELRKGTGIPTFARWLLVTSFIESAVQSIPLDAAVVPDVDARTRALPGRAIAAAHAPLANAIAVVGCDSGRVTWMRADDGSPVNGSISASSVWVGEAPLDALADPHEPLVYVSVSESRRVAVLDPATRDVGASIVTSLSTEGQPGILAFARARDLLFVRQRGGGTLVFDGDDVRTDPPRVRPRVIPTPPGRGLALTDDERSLLVPSPFDDRVGLCVYDLDRSLAVADSEPDHVVTGQMPFGVATHPSAPIAYVSCFRPPALEFRYTGPGRATSSAAETVVQLPSPARAMVVDPVTDTLFASCFDASQVLALDARTGARRDPASWDAAAGPRGMVVVDQIGKG